VCHRRGIDAWSIHRVEAIAHGHCLALPAGQSAEGSIELVPVLDAPRVVVLGNADGGENWKKLASAALSPGAVAAGVEHEAPQPGRQRGFAAKARKAAPGSEEGLLDDIVARGRVAGEGVGGAIDALVAGPHEAAKGFRISGAAALDQIALGHRPDLTTAVVR
jgi:hypothetical protein